MENLPKITGYDVVKRIGKGGFGECFQVKRKRDKKIMAMKAILVQDQYHKDLAIQEVSLLYSLTHPNILTYYAYFMDSKKQMIYIFTAFCAYGDLYTAINGARSKYRFLKNIYQGPVPQCSTSVITSLVLHCGTGPSCLVRPYHDKLLEAIKKGPPKPISANYSKLLRSTIKRMLDPKASTRPVIKDFIKSPSLASMYKKLKAQGNANYLA